MSTLRSKIQSAIGNFVKGHEDEEIPSDILRVIIEESNLMKEKYELCTLLETDPTEQLSDVKTLIRQQLINSLSIDSCARERIGFDYCCIESIVRFEKFNNMRLIFKYQRTPNRRSDDEYTKRMKWQERENSEKTKKDNKENKDYDDENESDQDEKIDEIYMRGKDDDYDGRGCHVWYSIELSENYGPKETIFLVQVWAPAGVPSTVPAICIHDESMMEGNDNDGNDEEEGGWEDIDENETAKDIDSNISSNNKNQTTSSSDKQIEDENQDVQPHKRQKINNGSANTLPSSINPSKKNKKIATNNGREDDDDDDDDDESDRSEYNAKADSFMVFLDPDILDNFLSVTKLRSKVDDVSAFFLLMTFPYYETEWDLIGYCLDQIFSVDDDDDDEDGNAKRDDDE